MKKLVFSLVLGSFISVGANQYTSTAAETTINNGSDTANVQINGTLGQSNTDPDAPINEGSDQWINVTLDTATIFYNTAGSTKIESPSYSIKNNSGRPVGVLVSDITRQDAVDISSINSLSVNMKRNDTANNVTSTATLITNGNATVSGATQLVLANNKGQLVQTDAANTTGVTNNAATFSYDGSLNTGLSQKIEPKFTMTLKLSAISWE